MKQTQNGAPSKSLSRDLVLKILSESGVHGVDEYLTDEMVRTFGLGGYAKMEGLKESLNRARALERVRCLTCEVDYTAAGKWPVPSPFFNLVAGSFKPMDWNLCVWEGIKDPKNLPNCRRVPRQNRTVEFVPIKRKVGDRGFSARSGLSALKDGCVRPVLAQEFVCYCNRLGGIAGGIQLVALGSVILRAKNDGLYGLQYLAYDSTGFRVAEEREKNMGYTDTFFIGVSQS